MVSDDIVTRLRMSADLVDGFPKAPAKNVFPTSWLFEAADEIERLRAERLEWFLVARQLRDALLGGKDKDQALDEYLRTRGRLEDARE